MKKFLFILSCCILSCTNKPKEPVILIKTEAGDIEAELYPEKSPQTVTAFLKNVDAGIYRNTAFYRVVKAEELPTDYNSGIIQGGIYSTRQSIQINRIPHESTMRSGLSHTNGIISMARTNLGTASTEFFICIGDQSFLDSGRAGTQDRMGMAAFGKVISGMNTVRKIQGRNNSGDALKPPVAILNIVRE